MGGASSARLSCLVAMEIEDFETDLDAGMGGASSARLSCLVAMEIEGLETDLDGGMGRSGKRGGASLLFCFGAVVAGGCVRSDFETDLDGGIGRSDCCGGASSGGGGGATSLKLCCFGTVGCCDRKGSGFDPNWTGGLLVCTGETGGVSSPELSRLGTVTGCEGGGLAAPLDGGIGGASFTGLPGCRSDDPDVDPDLTGTDAGPGMEPDLLGTDMEPGIEPDLAGNGGSGGGGDAASLLCSKRLSVLTGRSDSGMEV